MSARAVIAELVERFDDNREAYRSGRYNETQLRREFLDPFFEALGWDVFNRQGYAEAYKEVIHEAAIKIGGRTKAPDYCFRAGGGRPSFFVEAKKPSVDIRDAPTPAYQLRRYAWSAKLPVSILTDFEEFAVYDCRIRPASTDKAATARVIFRQYHEYPQCWDELAGLFSPEAIRRGALDRFIASKKVKKGTAEVDAAFLDEIESWRNDLARNIALRNKDLSQRDLNFAVQRTIDRLIFLRICEDRGIEPYGRLQDLLNAPNVYRRLAELFERADERYNSGLFYFTPEKGRADPPDELTLGLAIDDKPLKEIIRKLYYPDSPYEFAVLPAEILGQVYEQFLGRVIRLTRGHRAVVEEKPEVKKAGGVYYTPAYIVDYIVEHTVGRLLQEGRGRGSEGERGGGKGTEASAVGSREIAAGGSPRGVRSRETAEEATTEPPPRWITPRRAAKLRILDPACGSGSFLIGAYQYLLDWHRDRYVESGPEKHARGRNPKLYRGPAGDWRLTTAERKRILLNNIYGVDIDPQAVEVTKLSLLLKVLEGESGESLETQRRLFHERALPDLASNIKCGNSLIGPDFYADKQMSLLDDDEVYRINAFDWRAEFPHVFPSPSGRGPRGEGGFDAVIGNPPYVRQEGVSASKKYFSKHYASYHGLADLYVYFYERGLFVLRERGILGFITSSKFIYSSYGAKLRQLLGGSSTLQEILDYGDQQLFAGATTYPVVLLTRREQPSVDGAFKYGRSSRETGLSPDRISARAFSVPFSAVMAHDWILAPEPVQQILHRLASQSQTLSDVAGPAQLGIKTSLNQAFVIDGETAEAMLRAEPAAADVIKPHGRGRDTEKWSTQSNGTYLVCSRISLQLDNYPVVKKHLLGFEKELRARYEVRRGDYDWWVIRQVAETAIFDNPKIVYPDLCSGPTFALNRDSMYPNNTVFCIASANPALLAYLNSALAWFWIIHHCPSNRGGAYRLFNQYMNVLPVHPSVAVNEDLHRLGNRAVSLVDQLHDATGGHHATVLRRQITSTDRRIDQLVYELHGLTDEEIRIVEEATRG